MPPRTGYAVRTPALSINALMTLAAVVEHQGFTRAAEALGVSQAAVSQQVRDLERACGLPLISQHGRTLATTALGEELAAIGRRLALESRRAEKTVAEHVAGYAGHLTVGASMTTGVYLVPDVLARLRAARPAIHVEVEIANTEDIAQATVDGLVDVGVVEGPVKRPELLVTAFRQDELRCVVPPGHRLAGGTAPLEELGRETLLIRERGSGSREVLLEALAARGFTFATTVDIANPEAIVRAVAAGLGIAWVSALVAAAHDERTIAPLDVTDLRVTRTMSHLHRRDTAPSPPAQAFIELLADGTV